MRNVPVHACSDVTGFALLGHRRKWRPGAKSPSCSSRQRFRCFPAPASSLKRDTSRAAAGEIALICRTRCRWTNQCLAGLVEIGFDPQTSGGLLIAVPHADASRLVAELHAGGVTAATIVGHATSRQGAWVKLV